MKMRNEQDARWFKTLKEKYFAGISNVFLLTGNIGDYAVPGKMMMDYLIDGLNKMGMERIYTYNYSSGRKLKKGEMGGGQSQQDGWSAMLDDLVKTKGKNAYIVEYPEFLIPKAINGYMDEPTKMRLIDLHQVMNNRNFIVSDHILILVSESKSNIHDMFLSSTSRLYPINIEFPNEEERMKMIDYLKKTSDKEIKWEITQEQFAQLTAGLSRLHIEDLYLISEHHGTIDRKIIMKRKEELIKKEFGEIIEIFDTDGYNLDKFAGQEHIKAFHRETIIEPILSGDTSIVPKGILYMGPPGTGKTYFAKCLAGESGINFVEFKMSKILDKYVGEAEKNLEKAFNCFRSLAPVGVFIDEMDQALSRGGQDGNSVMRNLFGMFLAFLSEASHRGKIIWIGATNYPNELDEALKRPGRFDKKIPFLPPNREERIGVFKIHLNKMDLPHEITIFEELAEETEGYSQAEIEGVVVKALEVAKRRKSPVVNNEIMRYALECMASYQNEGVKKMTEIALAECNDLEFLPQHYREEKDNLMVRRNRRR